MVAGDSAATANVWLVLVDAAALAITAGGRRGVRMLLLLLTDMPSERTSGDSAGLYNIQEDDRAGTNSSFDVDFSESAATASLLLPPLLSASETDSDGMLRASSRQCGEGRREKEWRIYW